MRNEANLNIDYNLIFLYENKNKNLRKIDLYKHDKSKLDSSDSLVLFHKMSEENLLTTDNYNNLKLTTLAIEIIENGGWLEYVKVQNDSSSRKANKEKIDFEISKTNLELNKWFLKTKWLPHIISIISVLFSVYVYFDSKNDSKKLEERIEKIESTILTQKNVSKK